MSSTTSLTRETLDGVLDAWLDQPSEQLIVRALTIVGGLHALGRLDEATEAAARVAEATGIEVTLMNDHGPCVACCDAERIYPIVNRTRH